MSEKLASNPEEVIDDATVENEEIVEVENEEIVEVENEEIVEVENEEIEEVVPLSTYLELKNKHKKIKKEYIELKDKTLSNDVKEYKEAIKNKYIKLGYNDDLAEEFANDLADNRFRGNKTNSDVEDSIIEDIQDLAKDPLFSGIDKYSTEIIKKIIETKNKGYELDVEDAYLIVSRQGKTKLKEKRVNDIQRDVIEKKTKGSVKTNVATSGSNKSKTKYNLDQDDKKALVELQKMQPDAGWTAEKYHKMMKE